MAEARAAIRAFNEKNPTRRIQMNHMMQSVKARQRCIARRKTVVYLLASRLDARSAGRFAEVAKTGGEPKDRPLGSDEGIWFARIEAGLPGMGGVA
ncbi:MAG TPA: hypothetical protein VKY70_11485 [Pseudomonas sp.]|nr:hypothetical protein [Pseudomonas sp.]